MDKFTKSQDSKLINSEGLSDWVPCVGVGFSLVEIGFSSSELISLTLLSYWIHCKLVNVVMGLFMVFCLTLH